MDATKRVNIQNGEPASGNYGIESVPKCWIQKCAIEFLQMQNLNGVCKTRKLVSLRRKRCRLAAIRRINPVHMTFRQTFSNTFKHFQVEHFRFSKIWSILPPRNGDTVTGVDLQNLKINLKEPKNSHCSIVWKHTHKAAKLELLKWNSQNGSPQIGGHKRSNAIVNIAIPLSILPFVTPTKF